MNKRQVGSDKEAIAVQFLEKNGFQIIDTNYHFHKIGEIDIIAKHSECVGDLEIQYIVFIEVKYRNSDYAGYAAEAVTYKKQRTISKVAMGYIMENHMPYNTPIRFDVVAIDGDVIKLYKNAFAYIG